MVVGAGLALAIGLASSVGVYFAQPGAAIFEKRFPGFIEQNRRLRDRLRKLPSDRLHEEALANAEANLRWAARYQRLGFDPSLLTTFGEPVEED